MAICKYCGKEFDELFDAETFEMEFPYLSYSNFIISLCADCATAAIEDDEVDGIHFITCDRCGKSFDYVIDRERCYNQSGSALFSFWDDETICWDCAEETM